MPKYLVEVAKYGLATIEAKNESAALEKASHMEENEFEWGTMEDGYIINEVN